MEKLSATMTQLYSDAMPEEAIEGMIDFATAVAKVVDNFGLFQGALSSLGVVGGAKIISTILRQIFLILKSNMENQMY